MASLTRKPNSHTGIAVSQLLMVRAPSVQPSRPTAVPHWQSVMSRKPCHIHRVIAQ
ncbi:MAG: hypothetical protein OSA95_14520 [Opitutales bacterium]|nr:hypothetical protein [Opitutales bacterium]